MVELIGLAVLGCAFLLGVIGYYLHQDLALMDDNDRPEHVARREWTKATRRTR